MFKTEIECGQFVNFGNFIFLKDPFSILLWGLLLKEIWYIFPEEGNISSLCPYLLFCSIMWECETFYNGIIVIWDRWYNNGVGFLFYLASPGNYMLKKFNNLKWAHTNFYWIRNILFSCMDNFWLISHVSWYCWSFGFFWCYVWSLKLLYAGGQGFTPHVINVAAGEVWFCSGIMPGFQSLDVVI